MSIIRKEKSITQTEQERLNLDKTVQDLELGHGRGATHSKRCKALRKSTREDNEGKTFKSPRLGVEGCCGKGCNGCLVFWHAPEYAKARIILKKNKQGKMLSKDMVEILEIKA